jgi:hypothetical protein
MRTRRLTGFTVTLLSALEASAQGTAAPPPPTSATSEAAPSAPNPGASAPAQGAELRVGASASVSSETGSGAVEGTSSGTEDTGTSSSSDGGAVSQTGFETGLRLGVGVPVGKGGQSQEGVERNLNELTTWRAPFWIDVGYRLSQVTTLGIYGQLGVGGNGDACAGECDWSDLRIGAQAQWRFAPGSSVNPWLGVGVGYEWLSFRTLVRVPIPNPMPDEPESIPVRTAELLGGPELLLQGGLDFRLEDSLSVGPYASASVGQYVTDGIKCDLDLACPEAPSLDGAGFHAWLGVGLRGTYMP